MSTKMVAGVAGVAAVGWVLYRNNERKKLLELMEDSPAVFAARAYALEAKNLGPKHAWLKQQGGLQKKADALITLTNTTDAKTALAEIHQDLPKAPRVQTMLPELIGQGVSIFEETTGMEVPRSVRGEISAAAGSQGGQAVDQALTSGSGLYSWLFGQDANARTNPAMTWNWFFQQNGM